MCGLGGTAVDETEVDRVPILWPAQSPEELLMTDPAGAYTVAPDPEDIDRVLFTEPSGRTLRIHREDADPEDRFTSYRLAAGWCGKLPDH